MIDGINQLPAPLCLPKGHYWIMLSYDDLCTFFLSLSWCPKKPYRRTMSGDQLHWVGRRSKKSPDSGGDGTTTGWWFGTLISHYNPPLIFHDIPMIMSYLDIIDVPWYFHILEINHPNWRTHIFQRGRYTTNHNSYVKIVQLLAVCCPRSIRCNAASDAKTIVNDIWEQCILWRKRRPIWFDSLRQLLMKALTHRVIS